MVPSILAVILVAVHLASAAADVPGHAGVNEIAGAPVWDDESLWDDNVSAVAERLRLPDESTGADSSSFRLYPPADALLFGARPYSIALYGEQGSPVQLSVVFANKGDFGNLYQIAQLLVGATGSQRTSLRQEHGKLLRELPKAIKADADLISQKLTAAFGEPGRDKYGAGRTMAEKGQRWDWKDHAFLLTVKDDEYVALRLLPAAILDDATRSSRPNPDLKSRVETRKNGDVVVTGIPMVDQGPKGYCVPATMERMLRYMGIPADMYA